MGGKEHATLHLLYARFWHRVLYDLGIVDHPEPFLRLVHQGMILGSDGEKMSKSRGNVVNPDEIVNRYGADVLRIYEMFMGPLWESKPWNTDHVAGSSRFRTKVYSLFVDREISDDDVVPTGEQLKTMHKTVQKVTADIEAMSFNTMVSSLMIYTNYLRDIKGPIPKVMLSALVLLLSPIAPHLCEECWSLLGNKKSLAYEPWPEYDEKFVNESTCNIGVSVNGKKIKGASLSDVERSLGEQDILKMAMASESVKALIGDKKIKSTIFIPGRMLNIITD